ncbi:lysozyme [Stappia sp.]|uniref:lysozyme n=1 Tax=Stappia sp. TaxID=1870903 RepID=UPI003C7B6278
MSKRAKAALSSGLGLIALTATYLVAPWEGTKNLAYWDALGQVWTVCTGETKGVSKGDRYTDAECADMLYATLEKDYRQPLAKCIQGFEAAPLSWQASMLSLTYNIGTGAACKSTAAKRARAGDFKASCHAMTWYEKAGGRTIRGLQLRRGMGDANRIGELELCLAGLDGQVSVPGSERPPVPRTKPDAPAVDAEPAPTAWQLFAHEWLGIVLALLFSAAVGCGVWRADLRHRWRR